MSLKPQPPREMPPEIAAWGARHLADDDPYKLIGDLLYQGYHDQDFADLYHKEGRPALSPVLLALVLVFQALENLSDRKAAEAVECNLKWKYALHLPLDQDGFDSTDDADKPHLITDIAVTAATLYDTTALPDIRPDSLQLTATGTSTNGYYAWLQRRNDSS